MKKVFALFLALVLLSTIVAICLADSCSPHQYVYNSSYTRTYTKPYWTNCGYNHSMHAHTRTYKETINVYVCQKCSKPDLRTTTKLISETCPCAH